ncbi:MAG: DMT family transporter [Candidatus Moraniibacteriota bacterium]
MENALISKHHRGVAALFSCSILYACFGPLIRILSEMFATYAQVTARMGLAFIFLFTFSLFARKIKRISNKQILKAIILGFVSTSILVFFTIAITHIKIASTIFLLYAANMTLSFLVGTLLFKETLGIQKIIALTLAFVGLYIFMSADMALGLSFGALSAVLAGISEGVGNGIRKKLNGADKITVNIIQFFVITLCSSFLILFSSEGALHAVSLRAVIALIIFAILQLLLNHLLLYGFQNFDVNIGAVILSLELFFAAILGFVFFSESLTVTEMVGGAIIFIASVVGTWEFKKTTNLV